MKIYINSARESWIVDRFKNEWKINNKSNFTRFKTRANIIWIIAPWVWNHNKKIYSNKKIVLTIHHLEQSDFSKNNIELFKSRDEVVDVYHVLNEKTKNQLEEITDKPIHVLPFWIDGDKWFEIKNKQELKNYFNIDSDKFLVGSFQRDTEGKDLVSPKYIKGPDRLFEIIYDLNSKKDNLCVVLAGKRRQYIISKLKEKNIRYIYLEDLDQKDLNKLYNVLDLYIVSSRIEGGPFSIMECSLTKTPIISTNVGIAKDILSEESIYEMPNYFLAKPDVETAFKNVLKYKIPEGMKQYFEIFEKLANSHK